MTQRSWRIANWDEGFEISQSRRREGRMKWVAMPTSHDSRGYRKLVRREDGGKFLACWLVMVQLAARSHERGLLADDRGNPLTFEDLHMMTDLPIEDFEMTIPVLFEIGWLEFDDAEVGVRYTEPTVDGYPATTEVPLHDNTIQNNTKQDKTETEQNVNSQDVRVLMEFSKRTALTCWNELPSNRQKGKGGWLKNFADIVWREMIEPELVMNSVIAYYESPDGCSKYHRDPARLLEDRVWEEDEQVWDRENSTTPKLQLQDLEIFDRVLPKEGK